MTFEHYRHLSSISTRPTIPKYARRTGCYAKSVTAVNSHTDPVNKTTIQSYIWAMWGTMRSACQCPHANKGRGESQHSVKGCPSVSESIPVSLGSMQTLHCLSYTSQLSLHFLQGKDLPKYGVELIVPHFIGLHSKNSALQARLLMKQKAGLQEQRCWTRSEHPISEPSRYLTSNPTPLEQSWQPCHLSMSLKPGEQGLLISGGEWQALRSPKHSVLLSPQSHSFPLQVITGKRGTDGQGVTF